MLKLIFTVIGVYLILQFGLGINVNKHLEPILEPVMELVNEQADEGFPELSKQFLENISAQDLTEMLESQDLDLSTMTSMLEDNDINLEKLSEIIDSQEFDTEAAKEKLEELKKLVQEKIEENQ